MLDTNLLLAARLFSQVTVLAPHYCWVWRGRVTPDGYGRFSEGDCLAHRFVFELFNGPLDDEVVVRHRCDNPSCCNPHHLNSGTQQDNMDDRSSRGRVAKGSVNGRARLTEVQVRAILKDGRSKVDIAKDYGVSEAAIYDILSGRNWRHVSAEFGIKPVKSSTRRDK